MLCELLLGNSQRIFFIPGIGNEIFSSGKNLSYTADRSGYVLDAVDDHIIVVTEDQVTVLAHQLHDQTLSAGIPQLIKMLQLKFHHALHSRLLHIKDTGASDVLSEKHAEVRCG